MSDSALNVSASDRVTVAMTGVFRVAFKILLSLFAFSTSSLVASPVSFLSFSPVTIMSSTVGGTRLASCTRSPFW